MVGDGVVEAAGVASWLNALAAKNATLATQPSKIDFMRTSDTKHARCPRAFAETAGLMGAAGAIHGVFFFFNRLGCVGSIVVSVIGTIILLALMRGCSGGGPGW